MAAGSALSFMGGLSGASAAKRIAKMNAQLIKWEGNLEVVRHRREARMLVGAQTAAYAKGGVLTTEGTAADVIQDTAIKAESDALAMKYSYKQRAKITRKGGSAQARSMTFGAIGGLFSSAGSIIGMGK